jgi:hypothetical protein
VGLAMVIVSPTVVSAAPSPSAQELAVSVPSEPTPAPKGATIRIPIRVVNPGSQPVTVTITQGRVLLGDNGHASVDTGADPQWPDQVTFEPPTATLGAQQYADVVIVVQVPATIGSDLHFIGFLVSPVATTQGQVSVINQIGSFVTLDVPGPREARLQATLQIPGFTLAREAHGSLKVTNVGHSAVRFWGEDDTTSWPAGATPDQQRFDTSLAPVATTQSLAVTARPAWPVGFVELRGQIIYPSAAGSATAEVAFSKRVLVVDPWVIIVAAGLLLLGVFRVWVRHRRRRALRRSPASRRHATAGRPPRAR